MKSPESFYGVPEGALHPMVESNEATLARLEAAAVLKKAARHGDDGLDVPIATVNAALDKPGLDPVITESIPAVVMDPGLANPNQYAAGMPTLRRGVREATPMSKDGIEELRIVAGSTVHGRGNIGTMGGLDPSRDTLLEERYSGVATSAKTVQAIEADPRFIEAAGSGLLRKGLEDDWKTTQRIVADQQTGQGLAAFQGRVINPEDEWKRKQAEGRAGMVKSSDEGLEMFKTAPATEDRRLKPAPGKEAKMAELQQAGHDIIMELRQRIRDERKPFSAELLSLDLDINQLRGEVTTEEDKAKLAAKKKVLARLEAERSGLHRKMTESSPAEEALRRAEETYRRNFGAID